MGVQCLGFSGLGFKCSGASGFRVQEFWVWEPQIEHPPTLIGPFPTLLLKTLSMLLLEHPSGPDKAPLRPLKQP